MSASHRNVVLLVLVAAAGYVAVFNQPAFAPPRNTPLARFADATERDDVNATLAARADALAARVGTLEARIAELEQQVAQLATVTYPTPENGSEAQSNAVPTNSGTDVAGQNPTRDAVGAFMSGSLFAAFIGAVIGAGAALLGTHRALGFAILAERSKWTRESLATLRDMRAELLVNRDSLESPLIGQDVYLLLRRDALQKCLSSTAPTISQAMQTSINAAVVATMRYNNMATLLERMRQDDESKRNPYKESLVENSLEEIRKDVLAAFEQIIQQTDAFLVRAQKVEHYLEGHIGLSAVERDVGKRLGAPWGLSRVQSKDDGNAPFT